MLKWKVNRTIDLMHDAPAVERLKALSTLSSRIAHQMRITVQESKKDADLSGLTAKLSVILPDRSSMMDAFDGKIDGSAAVMTLPDICYSQKGEVKGVLYLEDGKGGMLPIYAFVLLVFADLTDIFIDPASVVPSISELLSQMEAMREVTTAAQTATQNANTAAANANNKAEAAKTAAEEANTAAKAIDGWVNATATVEMLPAESEPTVSVETTAEGKVVRFALPRGDTGATPVITFEVETGEAGTQVEIEQTGTAEKPVIKLTIPRGDTGAIEGIAYYDSAPNALGAASVGVSEMVSRGDHTHPMPTASDVGALAKDGTAADSAKLGGVASGQYALKNDIPGEYTLPAATASTLGGVKAGSGMSVASDGTLSGMRFVTILPIATYSTGATLSFSESPYSYTHFFAALNYCGTGFARMSGSAGQRSMVFSSVTCSDSGMLIRVAQINETSAMDNNWKLTRIQQYFISVSGDVELTQPASTQLGVFGIKSY